MTAPLLFGSGQTSTGTAAPLLFGGSSGAPNLSGGSGGTPGLQALVQQLQAQGGGGPSYTPSGFLGNLLGGVWDLGKGLVGTVGAGVHDLAMLGVEGATLGKAETDYKVDDIVSSLIGLNQPGHPGFHPTESAVIKDLADRYGPLAPGGEPASETFKALYNKPLSFALDAATIAGAAAKGAQLAGIAKLGGKAALEGEAALAGTGPASVAARAIEKLKGTPGIGTRRALSSGVRTGLESALAEGEALSPLYRLLPKQTWRTLESGSGANMFLPGTEALNPFTRLFTNPIRRTLTEPITKLEDTVAGLKGVQQAEGVAGITPYGPTHGSISMYEDLLKGAKERGLTRIDIQPLRRANYTTAYARKLVMDTTNAAFNLRNEQIAGKTSILKRYLDKDKAAGTTDMTNYVHETLGQQIELIDPSVGPLPNADWAAQRYADMETTPVTLHGRDAVVDTTLPPEVAAGLEGDPLMIQAQPVLDELRSLHERMGPGGDLTDFTPEHALAYEELQREIVNTLKRRLTEQQNPGSIPLNVLARDETRIADFADRIDLMTTDPAEGLRMFEHKLGPLLEKYNPQYTPKPKVKAGIADELGAEQLTLEGLGPELPPGLDPFEVADAINAAGIPEPAYFPFIQRKPKPHEYFTAKSNVGANVFARDPNERAWTGLLLRDGDYIVDPVEAYSRRAARRARAISTIENQTAIAKFTGREITPEEYALWGKDAIPEGWVAFAPDAIKLKHASHLKFQNIVEDLRAQGMSAEDAVARALDEVGNGVIDDLDKLFSGPKPPKVYAIPKAVDEQIHAASKWAKVGNPNIVKTVYDPLMNVWRSLVLTGSPRWILNNFLGNTVFGAMQGVKIADVSRVLTERMRLMWAKWAKTHGWDDAAAFLGGTELRKGTLAESIHSQLYETTGIDAGTGWFDKSGPESYVVKLGPDARMTRTGRFVQASREGALGRWTGVPHRISTAVRTFNQEIEGSFRDASFLTAVEKQAGMSAVKRTVNSFSRSSERMQRILDGGYTPERALAALDEVNHFYGNYTGLNPFERHIVRRFFLPFWAFYKHTGKLLLTFPFQYPGRAQVLMALSNVTQDLMKQYGPIPGYLDSAIPLGPPGAEVPFLSTAGANPFQGLSQDPTLMLSPLAKVLYEQFKGRDSFTGEAFTDPNTVVPFGSDQAYQIDPETGLPKEVALPRPGIGEALLSQIPQYDMIKRALAGGVTYDTADILDVLQGKGTVLDTDPESPTYGQPKYPQSAMQQLAKLSGFNVKPYDIAGYQENLTGDQIAVLKELIKRMTAQEMSA